MDETFEKKEEEVKEIKTCDDCNAACCRYIAMEIDCPDSIEDFENIKWYVCHKNVKIFVDEDYEWHIEFTTDCKHLGENNRCNFYERRPEICREYNQEECTFHNNYEEKYVFLNVDDVDKYIEEVFNKGEHIVPDEHYDEDEDDEDDDNEEINEEE